MKFHIINSFFEYGFLTRALVAGVLIGVTCGLLAPFVVLRRLSFSADGLAHASLGGVALSIFLLSNGPVPTLASYAITFVFTCIVATAIAFFSQGQGVHSDTATGVCYVSAFALGILLLSVSQGYSGHLEHFFFGSLLAVNTLECLLLAGLALIVIILCFFYWRWLGQWTFDEELARASGVPVAVLRYGLIILISATVILSTRVVGVLLVTAMLILPGAVGTLLGRSMAVITVFSISTALVSILTGLVFSNAIDVPPGPGIVLTGFFLFVSAHRFRRFRDRLYHSSGVTRAKSESS
ncbi:MAG: metal ABC transporter permease [Verrucomicrobiae bacterium]|nr:metal ABC transporter permease [Verrucomicrobiae bacterium]